MKRIQSTAEYNVKDSFVVDTTLFVKVSNLETKYEVDEYEVEHYLATAIKNIGSDIYNSKRIFVDAITSTVKSFSIKKGDYDIILRYSIGDGYSVLLRYSSKFTEYPGKFGWGLEELLIEGKPVKYPYYMKDPLRLITFLNGVSLLEKASGI